MNTFHTAIHKALGVDVTPPGTQSSLTKVREVSRTTVAADAPYIADDAKALTMFHVAKASGESLYAAVASLFVRHGVEWAKDTGGSVKDRSKAIAKACRTDLKAKLSEDDSLLKPAAPYISTLAKLRAHQDAAKPEDKGIYDLAAGFTPSGVPVAIRGWSVIVALLAEKASKESAEQALARACKIMENHAGSRYSAHCVSDADASAMIDALRQVVGQTRMLEIMQYQEGTAESFKEETEAAE
jgi:hypothetical protein